MNGLLECVECSDSFRNEIFPNVTENFWFEFLEKLTEQNFQQTGTRPVPSLAQHCSSDMIIHKQRVH
jgi:hypothetical protein